MAITSSHARERLRFVLSFVYCASLDWSKNGLSQCMQFLIVKKYCCQMRIFFVANQSNLRAFKGKMCVVILPSHITDSNQLSNSVLFVLFY